MDRVKEAADIIININRFRRQEIQGYELIKSVCTYFDKIKNENLSQADLCFLKFVSNISGVPHFYDLLAKFKKDIEIDDFNLNTFSSIFYESTLHTDEINKVHKFQREILLLFKLDKQNRFFLSATTSFGKTHLVFEVIKKMRYKNVLLIFPTIALLAENLERLYSNTDFKYFVEEGYSIHTLSEVKEVSEKNIFIYTPERFLSFVEKNELDVEFDFAFVDEVYKIDNDYIIDEEIKENERDVAYRLAVYYALKYNGDVLFAGPYIEFKDKDAVGYNSSFDAFLQANNISILDYNNYEIVEKKYYNIVNKKDESVDEQLSFKFKSKRKKRMLVEIVRAINEINDNVILYCPYKREVSSYSRLIIKSKVLDNHNFQTYKDFIEHISRRFNPDWSLIKALERGIGMHHGLIPKYIQKEIISLFNLGQLPILISTTTITEGVNTSAKNLVVLDGTKGDKPLKKFDAKNISGRAGRFTQHYTGRVIVLQNNFMEIINSEAEGIKHKNYDINSPKDEIDLFYSEDRFLTKEDIQKRTNINDAQRERGLPDYIFEQYKVISRADKIVVYDLIKGLSQQNLTYIDVLVFALKAYTNISFDGFQVVLDTIRPIVKNKNLQNLIDIKVWNRNKQEEFSLLSSLVHAYLRNGFKGSLDFKIGQGKKVDTAIKETSEFIFNTLKYQVVKYLGVFNLIYKYHLSRMMSKPPEEIPGIEKLLIKLEYNALSDNGRIASDYGVPSSIIEYYENIGGSDYIKTGFDSYEKKIFERIDAIVNRSTNKSDN